MFNWVKAFYDTDMFYLFIQNQLWFLRRFWNRSPYMFLIFCIFQSMTQCVYKKSQPFFLNYANDFQKVIIIFTRKLLQFDGGDKNKILLFLRNTSNWHDKKFQEKSWIIPRLIDDVCITSQFLHKFSYISSRFEH